MKSIQVLIATALTIFISTSCSSQTNQQEEAKQLTADEKVEVYYFHYTRRCATCNAVESVSKEAVQELYGDKVSFADYNLDEPSGEAKGKELNVAGQALLIVAGDQQIDITNEGFMNARSNPDKLKQIIKEKIDGIM